MKVNPIAAMFVGAINFDAVDNLSPGDLKKVEAIFDRAENHPKSRLEIFYKGANDGEEKKPE